MDYPTSRLLLTLSELRVAQHSLYSASEALKVLIERKEFPHDNQQSSLPADLSLF